MTGIRLQISYGVVAATLFFGLPQAAEASFIINFVQSGADVVATGSGSINTAGLTLVTGGIPGESEGLVWGTFPLGGSGLGLGAATPVIDDEYTGTITGSTSTFGTGSEELASSGSGDPFGLTPGASAEQFFLPTGYLSGSALSDSSTWSNTNIAALGLTPGTYTYNFGSGTSADFITLNIAAAPEPGTFLLIGMGGLALAARRRFLS